MAALAARGLVDVRSKEFSGVAWIWVSSRPWSERACLPSAAALVAAGAGRRPGG